MAKREPNAAATDTLLLNGPKEVPKLQAMDGTKGLPAHSKRTQWKQWAACISATLSMVAAGTVYGWTTTVNSRLNDTTAELPVEFTDDEFHWVVSVTVIGSMLGAFCGAYLAATFGRKQCLLATSCFYIVGWLLIIFAQQVWFVYLSRFVLGMGVGMSYTANPMYVSEVADVNIRGALSTLMAVNVFTGSLIACSVGPWYTYSVLGVVMLAIPVLFVLTFVWFPETPYYLVSKGKDAEAMKAIAFFTDIKDDGSLREELNVVKKNMGDNSDGSSFEEFKFKFSDIQLLMRVRNRRALLIIMGLILGQQLSGNFTTIQYLETMFKSAKIGIDSHMATIIVLAVGLVSGAIATMTVENAGRRPLLIYSSFGCAVTLLILGTYLTVNASGTDVSAVNLLPVIDVIIFTVVYQIGLGTMPNLLIGELFPTNVKGIAGAVITIFDGLMGFVVSKLYDSTHVFYLIFSGSCFVLFIFVCGFVPETKRKTFNEIQDILGEMRPFKLASDKTKCWPINRTQKVMSEEA